MERVIKTALNLRCDSSKKECVPFYASWSSWNGMERNGMEANEPACDAGICLFLYIFVGVGLSCMWREIGCWCNF
jgi:hypothetical protein